MLAGLYTFVFSSVFNVPVQHYPIYLFAGLLPWTVLLMSITGSLGSISGEAALVRRAPFPYQLLPISTVFVNILPFVILLVAFTIYDAITWNVNLVLLPMLLLPTCALILFTSSLAMVLAAYDVYNHTLRYVLGNLLTVWFFFVPIVYRPDQAGSISTVLRSVDPMNMIIGQFRDVLYYGHLTRPSHTVLMVIVCGMSFVFANMIFQRIAPEIPKEL
jgi:ABC-type polysaccharide/polyol phosphate export permease